MPDSRRPLPLAMPALITLLGAVGGALTAILLGYGMLVITVADAPPSPLP